MIAGGVLSCPNCGARLRWNGQISVVECRYCQTHVAVDTGARTDRATEAISVPRRSPRIAAVLPGVVAVATVSVTLIAQRRGAPGAAPASAATMSTAAELLATPLASTMAEVVRRHRVEAHPPTVVIKLADSEFDQIDWIWDAAHPEHVSSIVMRPRTNAAVAEEVIARARLQLGRRLRNSPSGGAQYSSSAGTLSFGSTLQISTSRFDDPAWKAKLGALWTVVRHAAFGTSELLDPAARRDLLDLGYPLGTLAQLPIDLEVDAAAAAVRRIAPNAVIDGPRHRISIEHPWIESATLGWDNTPGGKWTSIVLYFPVELGSTARTRMTRRARGWSIRSRVVLVPRLAGARGRGPDVEDSRAARELRTAGCVPIAIMASERGLEAGRSDHQRAGSSRRASLNLRARAQAHDLLA